MKINFYFLFLISCLLSFKCYCLNVNDLLADDPAIRVTNEGELSLQSRHLDSLEGLERIPGIENARRLDLSNNQLRRIHDNAFRMLPYLEAVDLRGNMIDTIGNSLFEHTWVTVMISDNYLPDDQLARLQAQLIPHDFGDRLVAIADCEVPIVGSTILGWVQFGMSLGIYSCLKNLLSDTRYARANIVVDSVLFGVNIANCLQMFYRDPRTIYHDPAVECLRNCVLLHNTLNAPETVCRNIRLNTGMNPHSFINNPIVILLNGFVALNKLVQNRLCRRWRAAQDLIALPMAICPSHGSKSIEGSRGVSAIISPLFYLARNRMVQRANNRRGILVIEQPHAVPAPF